MHNFNLKAIILATLMGALASGCSYKTDKTTRELKHPMDTLRIDVGSEAPSLDPTIAEDTSSTRIMFDLFSGLLDFDQENNPIPGMASSWNISTDGKTYTFHLRKNLKFSDGTPITAHDFVYSWQRLVNPSTASNYNMLLSSVVNANAIMKSKAPVTSLGISAPDDYTFVVQLMHPDTSFLKAILLPNAYVVPQKTIEKYGRAWINPANMVTSGAYKLKEHIVNGYIIATKNPHYYDESQVRIQNIKYFPYVETTTAVQSYKTGGLDVTWQTLPLDLYASLKQQFGDQVHTVLQEALYFYDFNMKNPVIANNPKLRKALTMAIDREILTRDVLKQGQLPLYSTVSTTVDNKAYANLQYDWAHWPRDKQIAEAKALLKKAGYNSTHPFEFTISYNTLETHKRIALALASMWQQAFDNAIKVKLQNMEWKTFIDARHNGNYQVARDGWVGDYNGITTYTVLYACKSGANNSHYCNPQYDELIALAIANLDPTQQLVLFKQALALPLNDYATIPLYQYTYSEMVKPYVKGYNPDQNYLEHVQSKWMHF